MAFPHIHTPQAAQVAHLNQQLEEFERLPAQAQRQIQAESLTELLTWGWQHSTFWRMRLEAARWTAHSDPWEVLASLPTLTRTDLQDHFQAMSCATTWPENSCHWTKTTGSTGKPVQVLKHSETYQLRYLAHALRGTIWHKLNVNRTLVRFNAKIQDGEHAHWGHPEAWFANTGKLITHCSIERDVSSLLGVLQTHRPGYLVSNASVAEAMAEQALRLPPQERPAMDAILVTGETVDADLRRVCMDAFGARVINRYTCDEVGWLAIQCPKHEHLHVMGGNVIIEIVDEAGRACAPGQPGKVLVTGLHSGAMPLIRYEVGDMAEWGAPCDCGINLPVIKRIWGRAREFIRVPSGELRYVPIITSHFLAIAPLRDMRLRYYNNPVLRFEVVCDDVLSLAQQAAITTEVHNMLGFECPVQVAQCARIDWGETDKRISFLAMDTHWGG